MILEAWAPQKQLSVHACTHATNLRDVGCRQAERGRTTFGSRSTNHGASALRLTLWLLDRGSLVEPEGLRFEQFSKSGTLLESVRFPSLLRVNTHGGEFQVIPEPATYVLALLAMPFCLILASRSRNVR